MEVCRLPPTLSVADVSRTSAEAVAALHKSMVTLRGELVRKNERIRALEESLLKKEERPKEEEEGSFEDMFVLQVAREDVDQILLFGALLLF